MGKLGFRCKHCKKTLTVYVGATIGGTQLYACPKCGIVQIELPTPPEGKE